jgi:hypothetical protein
VENLTPKESAIAARLDLTHGEKLELIKPLREAREARSEAYWGRWASKAEAEQGQRIAMAAAQTVVITAEDRSWATRFGLSLD